MCELPARSMPGSEMEFVEKTRIRGTNSRFDPGVVDGGAGAVAAVVVLRYFPRRMKRRS
jgi:hypothetical protein